jgi:hypothetical protein
MAATTTLKVNDLAEYHGSRAHFHGHVFRVLTSVCGHHDVAYATDEDRDVVLHNVRASSLTRIDAKAFWASFKKCRECGTEHRAEACPTCN